MVGRWALAEWDGDAIGGGRALCKGPARGWLPGEGVAALYKICVVGEDPRGSVFCAAGCLDTQIAQEQPAAAISLDESRSRCRRGQAARLPNRKKGRRYVMRGA